MAGLFIPNKNGKRPNSALSASSQNGQNFASSSSQPPPFNSSRPRTVSNSNSQPSSSRASLPHASFSASQPLSTTPLPLDPPTRAQIETLLPQILHLFQLQSQSLEGAAGGFELSDLADEESQELRELWNAGKKDTSDREKKSRETLGQSLVESLGGLLMRLAEKIGTELVDRKIEIVRREVDSLKNSSTSSIPNGNRFPAPPPPPLQPGSPLTSALERIQVLEQELQRSDHEREQLRQSLNSTNQLFEQRLTALENKTVDPRKRVASVGTGNLSPVVGGAENVAAPELEKLKKEVEELKTNGKRAREMEEEEREGREKVRKLKERVEEQDTQLQQVRDEREEYLQKLQTQATALDTLSTHVSTLHNITELESSLLRGLYEFLTSSPDSQVESLSSSELSSLLTQRLFDIQNWIRTYREVFESLGPTVGTHGQRIELLHAQLEGLKPFFEYMQERALPDIQKSLTLSKAREGDVVENGGGATEEEDQREGGGEGEDEVDQVMEESDEDRAIERRLVNGTNGVRSSDQQLVEPNGGDNVRD